MTAATVLSLALIAAAPPPEWSSTIYLHRPLLPNTVTELTFHDKAFNKAAIDLARTSAKQLDSGKDPEHVHDRYRKATFGEHLVIKHQQGSILISDSGDTVLALVIGFQRSADSQACKIIGVFAIDPKGTVREFREFRPDGLESFEGTLQRHFVEDIQRVEAARRPAAEGR